jgi:hypothetical protein
MYATVTEVSCQPYEKFGRWWVDVKHERGSTTLMFNEEGLARDLCVGAWFLV